MSSIARDPSAGWSADATGDVDAVDRALLRALRIDGRTRANVLARQLGLSQSTVSVRLRRLVRSGVLRGVRADIDPTALGRPLQAVARVRYAPGTDPAAFERLLRRLPAVESGMALAGDADLELRLCCTDRAELRTTVTELCRGGAADVRVELVLRPLAGLGGADLAPQPDGTPPEPLAPSPVPASASASASAPL
ncbi:Lrp/AsnC family transcriptional regulator [Peterkaempfera sp. SMS 1(5)a]|uniref:Lrp/AsnC family transcriptional regulator n=1 Tax=Peterkaempfera podocarpi TaxID=3232308 RepID=UPI00366DEDDE